MKKCVYFFAVATSMSSVDSQFQRLQKRRDALYSTLRSEFLNYAVGPWVSVAGRETALARGNPANPKGI